MMGDYAARMVGGYDWPWGECAASRALIPTSCRSVGMLTASKNLDCGLAAVLDDGSVHAISPATCGLQDAPSPRHAM
jgi:hypothetical protein